MINNQFTLNKVFNRTINNNYFKVMINMILFKVFLINISTLVKMLYKKIHMELAKNKF